MIPIAAVWGKKPKDPLEFSDDPAPGQGEERRGEASYRTLGVTLSPRRQLLLDRIHVSSQEIQANVGLLPYESIRPAARMVVDQQKKLIPEIEQTLYLAEWLEHKVADLEQRARGESPPQGESWRRKRQPSFLGLPQAAEPPAAAAPSSEEPAEPAVDSTVQARIDYVRQRIEQMDAEAERVSRLLIGSEANLLATISERDEGRLSELFTEFTQIFEMHYQAVREVNQDMQRAEHLSRSSNSGQ